MASKIPSQTRAMFCSSTPKLVAKKHQPEQDADTFSLHMSSLKKKIVTSRQNGEQGSSAGNSTMATKTTTWAEKMSSSVSGNTFAKLHLAEEPTPEAQNKFTADLHTPNPPQQSLSSVNQALNRPLPPNSEAFGAIPEATNAYENQRQVPLTQGSLVQSQVRVQNRRTDRLHKGKDYEPGVIFIAPHHSQHYDQGEYDQGDAEQSVTRFGTLNSKERKFIVVACFAFHAVALPVYTCKGHGVGHKQNKNEYVSVREIEFRGSAKAAETDHGLLWAQCFPEYNYGDGPSFHKMNDLTAVHITAPIMHSYSTKCTIDGELEPSSRIKLQDIYLESLQKSINEGPQDVQQPARRNFAPSGGSMVSLHRDQNTQGAQPMHRNWSQAQSRAGPPPAPSSYYQSKRPVYLR